MKRPQPSPSDAACSTTDSLNPHSPDPLQPHWHPMGTTRWSLQFSCATFLVLFHPSPSLSPTQHLILCIELIVCIGRIICIELFTSSCALTQYFIMCIELIMSLYAKTYYVIVFIDSLILYIVHYLQKQLRI